MSPLSSIPSNIQIYSKTQTAYPNLLVDANVEQGFEYHSQTNYFNMIPTNAPKVSNGAQYFVDSSNNPINACPQCFGPGDSLYASVVSLPLSYYNHTLTTKFWVIPGNATGTNSQNTPINTLNATTLSQPGLASILYAVCLEDTTIFLELGGARGGRYPLMSGGLNPVDITPYTAGSPGIVYGTFRVKKNDVLKIYLGSPGHKNDTPTLPFSGQGQGGIGTLYGGAFGGGCSYITHYPYSNYGHKSFPAISLIAQYESVLDAAIANDRNAQLVCVAAGGGGSSRHASGGSGGSSNDLLAFGDNIKTNRLGSAGGLSYTVGTAPMYTRQSANDLSGGGGAIKVGGASKVQNATSSCMGRPLIPFVDNGGGSVITDVGSGGAGGGGGLYGGGAGAYNDLAKPNNVHGAGGGGTSWFGLLGRATNKNSTLNIYRSSALTTEYGYIVIGVEA